MTLGRCAAPRGDNTEPASNAPLEKVRGKPGLALIQIEDTGEIIEVQFAAVQTAAGKKKRPSKTPYEFTHSS